MNKQKGVSVLIIILIVVGLGAVVGGGYFAYQKYLSPTAGWKTYVSEDLGMSFRYPPN